MYHTSLSLNFTIKIDFYSNTKSKVSFKFLNQIQFNNRLSTQICTGGDIFKTITMLKLQSKFIFFIINTSFSPFCFPIRGSITKSFIELNNYQEQSKG
jgi:hypothetical protein